MSNFSGGDMERIKKLLSSDVPLRWLFTGDSITHGALHTFGSRDYVQIFEERVRWEIGRVRDHIIRTAISGYKTGSILEDIQWNVLQYHPHIVSIMIGMNDAAEGIETLATFRNNYLSILDSILSSRKDTAFLLHTPNPVIPGTSGVREENLSAIADTIIKIGKERNIPVIDHYKHWQMAWKENPIRIFTWMTDGVHPGSQGHLAFARLLLKEIGIWDEHSVIGRFFIL
jgi:lysophospholipase L1-like esterase